jgi:23S rRNA (cytidine2498-2'-O)-methyltransferase
MGTLDVTGSDILFSAHEDYLRAAGAELDEVFPRATTDRVGPDAARLRGEGIDISSVAAACRDRPIVFVRHLAQVAAEIPYDVDDLEERITSCCLNVLSSRGAAPHVALQLWRTGASFANLRSDELRRGIAGRLTERGLVVSRGRQDQILSVLLAPRQVIVGFNRREEALVDWPGGRLSLARGAHQISRSEFKLEELFRTFDVPLPASGAALDLGASPGGWTRILRSRGLSVWAVDPADLDPRLAADQHVHHERTTAGPFLAGTQRRFDLIVDDMRMTPTRSCGVMLDASRKLTPGGLIIMTLKIASRRALETVRTCLVLLERSYDILFARQLYHNRNEITVVGRRRRPSRH